MGKLVLEKLIYEIGALCYPNLELLLPQFFVQHIVHTAPKLLFTVLFPSVVGCSVEVVQAEHQEAMRGEVPASHGLGDAVASQTVAVDHGH